MRRYWYEHEAILRVRGYVLAESQEEARAQIVAGEATFEFTERVHDDLSRLEFLGTDDGEVDGGR